MAFASSSCSLNTSCAFASMSLTSFSASLRILLASDCSSWHGDAGADGTGGIVPAAPSSFSRHSSSSHSGLTGRLMSSCGRSRRSDWGRSEELGRPSSEPSQKSHLLSGSLRLPSQVLTKSSCFISAVLGLSSSSFDSQISCVTGGSGMPCRSNSRMSSGPCADSSLQLATSSASSSRGPVDPPNLSWSPLFSPANTCCSNKMLAVHDSTCCAATHCASRTVLW
mmetsp:Transcript_52344/g.114178  ORF Transcript_52344/g.114178 Transcript_52344/m.114178 type:complete len:224 (+) Transcript_52344:328-999(+)